MIQYSMFELPDWYNYVIKVSIKYCDIYFTYRNDSDRVFLYSTTDTTQEQTRVDTTKFVKVS